MLFTDSKLSNSYLWLKWQYAEGAEVASICLGAFLLASTGLLDGKTATTHWLGAKSFRKMFPKVTLLDDKIIVDHNRIYSSGGAFSFTSLMMYLIGKFFDHQAAMLASKVFMIHIHDTRQTSYSIFHHQKDHGDSEIAAVQDYIERKYKSSISNEQLAKLVNISDRTLVRRFKKATGNTPYEYVQRIRIEAAKKLLENRDTGIEQIALEIGYEDFSAFRKVFKRLTGVTPLEYKRKYGKTFLPDYVNIS
jgi:transcriptional regulator GlxA family with amidase domain